MSEAEQVKPGKRPPSDLYKATESKFEAKYEEQKHEVQEMKRKMSQMQQAFNQQIAQMRESQENYVA